ncbi:DUF6266 family protein [Pedobacter faecalis]|uniref:DUF6266 family protein n=1 Tax=Pedobacter faecalis TaxID=3041495 RepID=UPI00254D4841|nr:DUF6266 family protein [Pedobacter sp. ELA7]
MARYSNGINGPVSGKVGSVVGASWRGVDYMRSLPVKTKESSEAQLAQQEKFAVAVAWLKPLLEIINVGYHHIKIGMTPHNAAMSYYLTEAVTGTAPDFVINFSKAIFSEGPLITSFVTEVTPAGSCLLNFKWENAPDSIYSSVDDRATFVLYNPQKEKFVLYQSVAARGERSVTLSIPNKSSGDTVHGYLFFVRADGEAVSTTLYLGPLIVP